MEKRFLLAFFLSFVIITSYSLFRPRYQSGSSKTEAASLSFDPGKNFYTRSEQTTLSKEQSGPPLRMNELSVEEKTEQIETDKITANFSNIGGRLTSITLKEFDHSLPITNIINFPQYENFIFHFEKLSPNSVAYSAVENGIKIVKVYKFSKEEYLINLDINIKKIKTSLMSNDKHLNAFVVDFYRMDNKKYPFNEQTLFEYSVFADNQVTRKDNLTKIASKNDTEKIAPVKWIGFRDKYFCLIVQPEFKVKGYATQAVEVKKSLSYLPPVTNEKKLNINLVLYDEIVQESGDQNFKYKIYVGPQQASILKKYDDTFKEIISFNNINFFDFIAKGIHALIVFLHKIVPNFGICIIITSIFIFIFTYPFTMKSMMSMKKMQILQPKLAKLREQHKNNPQKLNKEMMELYKEHKINPLAGCLPMVCQIPIFIGLYQVLGRSIIFRGANFLWIKDLSEPDRLFIFQSQLPFIGKEFNILPILMSLLMFFQQKMSAQSMSLSDPAQAAQQKMMTIFLPILIGVSLYKFASGVSLYFTVSYFLSFFTQWKLSKKIG